LHQVTEVAKVLIDSSKNKYIRKDLEKSRTFLFLSNNKGRGDHMTFTYRYRKQIIIALFSVLLLGIGGCFLYFSLGEEKVEEKKVITISKKKKENKIEEEIPTYKIDIKGEVMAPGIYTLRKDSRVMDAITEAGGLTEKADTSVLNLSKKVEDEMVIIVYSYEEVADFKRTKELESEVQETCKSGGKYELENDACIKEEKKNETVSGSISINTASKEELMTLPGIGEAKAISIISYREEHGSFEKIEDIMQVSGIGESVFAKIKENITT